MHKKVVVFLACLACACHARVAQKRTAVSMPGHHPLAESTESHESRPKPWRDLAVLLRAFNSAAGHRHQSSMHSSKVVTSNAPGMGRRDLLAGGLASTGAALLAQEPAYARNVKRYGSDGEWALHKGDFSDQDFDNYTYTASGLGYKVIEEGFRGTRRPKLGETVLSHFATYIEQDGKAIDNSWSDWGTQSGYPLECTKLGVKDKIIAGWSEALLDMRPGEKRILRVPPKLAYGQRGAAQGVIPAGTRLVYYIELVLIVDDDSTYSVNREEE